MPEDKQSRLNFIYNIVESVVLILSCGLMCWCASTVISQGREISSLQTLVIGHTERINNIEAKGSPTLQAMSERMKNMEKSLDRIEESLKDHMKDSKTIP